MDDTRLNTIETRLAESERWRGAVDQRMHEHERRLTSINGSVAHSAEALSKVALELAKRSAADQVKGEWSGKAVAAVSGVTGGIVVGVAVYLITGGGA